MLITINYDGINHACDDVAPAFIDSFYDVHPSGISFDVIEVPTGDIYKAYDMALDNSDRRLSISYIEYFSTGAWHNIHEKIEL